MKHTITALILLIFAACGSMDPEDQIIKDELFVLGQEVVEIKCDPPLKRTRDDGSIFILIAEEWEPVHPYKLILNYWISMENHLCPQVLARPGEVFARISIQRYPNRPEFKPSG
jgi:hypothetical protein